MVVVYGWELTISGFDESILHIGDQLSIGQCILEITQPRVPCYKLGIAVGNKKMPRLFIENFATGAYLRVIQEGFIETGSRVRLVKESEFKVTVKSLFMSYFDENYQAPGTVMKRALLVPELSSEWSKKLSVRLSSMDKL